MLAQRHYYINKVDLTMPNWGKSLFARSVKDDAPPLAPESKDVEIQTENPAEIWQEIQDSLSDQAGLSILLVDGRQPPSLAVSNNNSICRVVQSSAEHAPLCEPYCGKAFENVQKAGKAIEYRCHAGLKCVATPLAENPVRPLVAIVGRAFTKVSDYQQQLDRALNGDLQDLPQNELFRSLRFAESEKEISDLAKRMQNLDESEILSLIDFVAHTDPNPFNPPNDFVQVSGKSEEIAQEAEKSPRVNGHHKPKIIDVSVEETLFEKKIEEVLPEKKSEEKPATVKQPQTVNETLEDFTAWQLFTDVLLDKSFKEACAETLRFISVRYDFATLAWLERSQHLFKPFIVADSLRDVLATFSLSAEDPRLQEAVLNETSLWLEQPHKIEIFPLAVSGDVRAAIIVVDEIADDQRRKRVARFCHQIAVSLEVLRLREELSHRAEIVRAVQFFGEKLAAGEENYAEDSSVDLFQTFLQTCGEILNAERGSLLLFDEIKQRLKIQAAFGNFADDLKETQNQVGERVAERVFREGKPVVVENITNINLPPAPPERGYRSKSFISYPLFVGNRAIGVLNVTDKRDDTSYGIGDLDLLEAIAPQLAIALDRASLHKKAGKFQQLSITDSLTGLLNRRYLDERLQEEVNRSNREGSPMSFMMIDIDNFKQYNDRFGHQAGDEVLRMTAACLKTSLRSADIAARFGGEEFCLLLPNTNLSEARMIGERIRQRVENTNFPNRVVTVSVGVSAYSPLHNSPQEIIEAADKALYQAKRIGKNNVQLWLFGQTRK